MHLDGGMVCVCGGGGGAWFDYTAANIKEGASHGFINTQQVTALQAVSRVHL